MATEKRLIDANKVEFALAAICNRESGIPLAVAEWLANVVRNAPTVDAVEVVRCKDCKNWIRMEDDFGDCTSPRFHLIGHADPTMHMNDYCSCGERRTDET